MLVTREWTTKRLIREVERVIERLTERDFKLGYDDSNRLPSYESIYEKLRNYENTEEERRLVILPKCKIGDTVYLPIDFQNKIYTGKVEGFEYAKMRNTWVVKIRTDDEGTCYEAFEDFRKTFFLDVEDAAKKLKEMKKNE